MKPFVSICIPAYKRTDFLIRLLDSISIQTFKDYEVVITDDSNDESVASLIKKYSSSFTIHYYKNQMALGTPSNWNAAIRLARGGWIKLMHDDDWFADENSLQEFSMASKASNSSFIFSGFKNVNLETGYTEQYILRVWHEYLLKRDPHNLLKQNFIGHPSTTFIKNDLDYWYDERLKWVVDIEFYTRVIKSRSFSVIRKPLVNLGISNEQVTKSAFRKPEVEIPENLYLLEKISPGALNAIFAFDYFWRLIRNLSIKNMERVRQYFPVGDIPPVIKLIVSYQKHVPAAILQVGVISKMLMLVAYLHCRLSGRLKK